MQTSKLNEATRRLVLAAAICVGLALGGCPSYRVTGFELVPGSVKPGAFSLGFQVEVTVPEPAPDEEPDALEGRGLIGIWLPVNWKATGLKMKGPDQEAPADLALISEFVPALPRTFPSAPGAWWPFATDCLDIGPGVHVYEFVVAASGPKDETETTVGVVIELFDAEVSATHIDSEVNVNLTQETAVEVAVPVSHNEEVKSPLDTCVEPDTDAGLDEEEDPCDCPKCPPQVDRGARGCSCEVIGSANQIGSLVGLIAAAF